jgi:hypothetical protein
MKVSKLINYLFDETRVEMAMATVVLLRRYSPKSENKPKLHQEMWCEVQRKSGFTQQTKNVGPSENYLRKCLMESPIKRSSVSCWARRALSIIREL